MKTLSPYLYFLGAGLLGVLALASVISAVQALTVRDTVTAIESALGTAFLAILLAVFTQKLFRTGLQRLRNNSSDLSSHN